MKKNVAIITIPLGNNYGAILQNYALQTLIKKNGANPITIDYVIPGLPVWKILCSWLKSLFYKLRGKKRKFIRLRHEKREKIFSQFISKFIQITPCFRNLNEIFKYKDFSVCIVGSDQVWRPTYNYHIQDMFLDFCKKKTNLRRIAYAASFGVDNWEYTPKQTAICSSLAKKFDFISIREESGVDFCKKYFNVDATWVLDPTLLLKKEDYNVICSEISVVEKKFLFAYVLDLNESIRSLCESIATKRGLVLKICSAGAKSTLTVPEWLAMIRDASYVVTDSFHGTAFSIIFEKEFKCIYNKNRGTARFETLMNLYNSGKIDEMRIFSQNWLEKALDK